MQTVDTSNAFSYAELAFSGAVLVAVIAAVVAALVALVATSKKRRK